MPRARANAVTRDPNGVLRVRLTAPPVEGAANRALIDVVAKQLGLRRADLEIVHGHRGRDKRIAVHGCSADELGRRIERLAASDVDNPKRRG